MKMGIPKVNYKQRRKHSNKIVPGSFILSGILRRMFKKGKYSRSSARNKPFTFGEWLLLIIVGVPLILIFIKGILKFLMWLGIIFVCFKLIRKNSRY
ncbi:hypothetical protein COA01_32610 [Bacillus cereus]|nr:hypothetical protein COA01_32610 [Bacillus cereus]